jgi:Ser/Thr protein kinase RdoA (MazF antagonist)
MMPFDVRLLAAVSAHYGVDLHMDGTLGGGYESRIIQARSRSEQFVIRVSPPWRSVDELTWAYELASYAASEIPEALAPVRARDGSLAFEHEGCVASLFPFVAGAMLDRASAHERHDAARLLARLHRVLPMWPNACPRPGSRGDAPTLVPNVEPVGLDDPELDAAVAYWTGRARRALTHGDYYRGNVRCADGRIVALFDWDDACYWTLENELAWSVWEFAQADSDATLDVERADQFLETYAGNDGPVALGDTGFVIPFIRDDIRTEIREAAAAAEAGLYHDPDYVKRLVAAFETLRHR